VADRTRTTAAGHVLGAHRTLGRRNKQYRAGRASGAQVPARETSAGRVREIDLLRFCAALAVVIYHYTFSGFYGHYMPVSFGRVGLLTRYGYLGVDLFFVISGFVVLLSAWGRPPDRFVISRMVRLYPAYWVAVTLSALVIALLGGSHYSVSPTVYAANMTLANQAVHIPNVDVVYWTLWAEIRFYLVILVLSAFGITRGRVIGLLWAWLAVVGIEELGVLPLSLASHMDIVVQAQWAHYFIAGMALCLVYRYGWSVQLAIIVPLAWANAIYRAVRFAAQVSDRYHQVIHPLPVAVIVTFTFIVMALIASRVTARFQRPWFAAAGALTYPLYLVHAYIGFIVFGLAGRYLNKWLLLALLVAVMLGAAYLINRYVEARIAPLLKSGLTRISDAARPRIIPPPRGRHAASSQERAQLPNAYSRPDPGPAAGSPDITEFRLLL
jgi:peptidoglycan/LPS O-acetylase OafA/YrhL